MSKYKQGSEGAAHAKETLRFNIIFTALGVLVFLANYVFNTDLKDNVKAAPAGFNIAGIVLHIASLAWLWLANILFTGNLKWHPGILWLVIMAVAIFVSCGFFAYTY